MPNYKDQKQELKVSQEDWMVKKWRPAMGWTYMATVIFDFIIGPILYNVLQYLNLGQAIGMWTPLTLQGGGMYHLAMGAVLGVSAWSRGQEKINGLASPDVVVQQPVMMAQPAPTYTPTYTPPTPEPVYTAPVVEQPVYAPINTINKPIRKTPNF